MPKLIRPERRLEVQKMTKVPIHSLAILGLAGICLSLVVCPAFGQKERSVSTQDLVTLATYFYKDPRPERLDGFLDKFEAAPEARRLQAYPPVAGFLAVVFRASPDWIEKLTPTSLTPEMADTLVAALRLSGNSVIPDDLQARIQLAGSDEQLRSDFSRLPDKLEDLHIATPADLDILWGAAFASGDTSFILMIASFLAETANQSEQVALDVAKTARAMMGGPKDILHELRGKYGDQGARQIVYAAAALWSLTSNAKRHAFVDQAVTSYISDHLEEPAAKALSALRTLQ